MQNGAQLFRFLFHLDGDNILSSDSLGIVADPDLHGNFPFCRVDAVLLEYIGQYPQNLYHRWGSKDLHAGSSHDSKMGLSSFSPSNPDHILLLYGPIWLSFNDQCLGRTDKCNRAHSTVQYG